MTHFAEQREESDSLKGEIGGQLGEQNEKLRTRLYSVLVFRKLIIHLISNLICMETYKMLKYAPFFGCYILFFSVYSLGRHN